MSISTAARLSIHRRLRNCGPERMPRSAPPSPPAFCKRRRDGDTGPQRSPGKSCPRWRDVIIPAASLEVCPIDRELERIASHGLHAVRPLGKIHGGPSWAPLLARAAASRHGRQYRAPAAARRWDGAAAQKRRNSAKRYTHFSSKFTASSQQEWLHSHIAYITAVLRLNNDFMMLSRSAFPWCSTALRCDPASPFSTKIQHGNSNIAFRRASHCLLTWPPRHCICSHYRE